MSKKTQKWLISSVVTFFTAFAIATLPLIDNISIETIKNGAIVGVVFAGVRAGVKALFEFFISVTSDTTNLG